MTRVRDRERALSGDMISDLGPVIDPLNHNCISVYNKRKAMVIQTFEYLPSKNAII